MHTVLRLGFSSRTELEWDFSKRLTQQACSFYPLILADGVLCAYNAYRESVLLFHFEQQAREIQEIGVKKSWVDGGVGGGGRRRKKEDTREREKRAGGEI